MTRYATTIAGALALSAALALASGAFAHDGKHPDRPNPSPNHVVSQEVGYEVVTIKYGSPGVKGRTIWGDLVPFNGGDPRPWVAGANGSTIITFEEDVKVNGNDMAAGSYGLHVIPSETEWIFIFNTDSSRFGVMKYKGETDALRLTIKPEAAPFLEWLEYEFHKDTDLSATVSLHWEKLSAGFTIEAPDHRKK